MSSTKSFSDRSEKNKKAAKGSDLQKLVGCIEIYVAVAVFQPYRDLEAGDNQSLKFKWRGAESNPLEVL